MARCMAEVSGIIKEVHSCCCSSLVLFVVVGVAGAVVVVNFCCMVVGIAVGMYTLARMRDYAKYGFLLFPSSLLLPPFLSVFLPYPLPLPYLLSLLSPSFSSPFVPLVSLPLIALLPPPMSDCLYCITELKMAAYNLLLWQTKKVVLALIMV